MVAVKWTSRISCLFLAVYSSLVIAGIPSTDYTIHQQFLSVRALGMGNAFSAVVDDTSAFWYNPAALAHRKDHELKMSLGAGMDTKVLKFYGDIKSANSQPTQSAKVDAITNLVQQNTGNYYSIRAPTVGAFYAWPHWQVSFIPADLALDMSVHRCAGPCLNVNGYLDSTFALTYGHELNWVRDHQMAYGVTLKSVHRVYAGQQILAADLVTGTDVFAPSQADEGLTFDADVGFLWSPTPVGFLKYAKPTFAVVGHNLVDYGFTTNFHVVDKATGQPPRLGRRADVGMKIELPKIWIFDWRAAVDERDMGDSNFTFEF